MRLSNSKVKTWRRCPKRYEFKYIYGLEPKKKGIALERGSWIHSLLEVHYDGGDWRDRHKELKMEFYSLFDEEREHLGDLPTECSRIMRAYLRHWKKADRNFVVVDTEMNETVTLPNGVELNVIVDLIVQELDTGLLWAWDHKTRKKFGDEDDMVLDPQLTLYFKALEIMGYKPLGGVVYNELRTKPPTVPQPIKSGARLQKKKDIDTDVHTYMKAIEKHGFNPADYKDILLRLSRTKKDAFFKRTILPKDPPQVKTMIGELVMTRNEIRRAEKHNEFPRTFEPRQCKWDCPYLDVCVVQMHGGDIESLIQSDFEVRNGSE